MNHSSLRILIETSEVCIRHLETFDHQKYISLEKNPIVKQYVGGPSHKSNELLLSELAAHKNTGSELLIIARSETNEFIGRCGLLELKGTNELELYCLLLLEYWGKGLGTLVTKALIHFAHLHGKQPVAFVDPQNKRSISMLNRLGGSKIGVSEKLDWQHGHLKYAFP